MRTCLLVVVTILASATTTFPQDSSNNTVEFSELKKNIERRYWDLNLRALVDIGPIGVFVGRPGEEYDKKAGITREELIAFVELKLRQNGISILSRDAFLADDSLESPFVHVDVGLLYLESTDTFVYNIEVQLWLDVGLLRGIEIQQRETSDLSHEKFETAKNIYLSSFTWVAAVAWDRDIVGIASRNRVRTVIKDGIDTLLTSFMNEYLKANPPGEKKSAEKVVIFTGVPETKIWETGSYRIPENLTQDVADKSKCTITKTDGKYYWTTREDVELVPSVSGAFTTFRAINGSGYVRIVNPELEEAVKNGLGAGDFDYVEHLLAGLNSVTYYGKSE